VSRVIDLTGQRFGKLTVLRRVENDRQGKARWACVCECRQDTVVSSDSLRSGNTQSCGCWGRTKLAQSRLRHGHARKSAGSKLYKAWCHLKSRCLTPTDHKYPCYGGRGITVCERWVKGEDGKSGFECFAADMGPHPGEGWSIDRKDNDGPYSPDNCRWATADEQSRNRRNNLRFTIHGETRCLKDWARRYGMRYMTVYARVEDGWPVERALTAPIRITKRLGLRSPVQLTLLLEAA
jgi:hypothetical protein